MRAPRTSAAATKALNSIGTVRPNRYTSRRWLAYRRRGPLLSLASTSTLLKISRIFQDPAGAVDHGPERVLRDVDPDASLLGEKLVESREECAAASQGDTASHHVRYQLRRCLLDGLGDGFHDRVYRPADGLANLSAGELHLRREAISNVAATNRDAPVVA